MNLDKIITEKLFEATKNSAGFSRLAIFGARRLVWFLAGAVILRAVPFFVVFYEEGTKVAVGAAAGKQLLAIVVGVFAAWIGQLIVAFVIRRRRPFQQNHEKPLMEPLFKTPSFPSGHTTVSCALAASVFAFDPFVGAGFFVLAALVAWCRVAIGVHYFSDVIGGAVLGIGVVLMVTRLII